MLMMTALCLVLLGTCLGVQSASAQGVNEDEVLYNGIRLESPWPPRRTSIGVVPPPPPPYLVSPPAVIPIDVGRQLFVDDFLIAETSMKRSFHQAQYHWDNPILKPDNPWEQHPHSKSTGCAMPFSDGVWYDPADGLFKMWYMGGYVHSTCYATSEDGIHWDKPLLDVHPGTNIVWTPPSGHRDSTTVWLDLEAKDPNERFVLAFMGGARGMFSPDGIHWGEVHDFRMPPGGDRGTLFYNPFRKIWVFSVRAAYYGASTDWLRGGVFGYGEDAQGRKTDWTKMGSDASGRVRQYWEAPDLNKPYKMPEGYKYGVLTTANPEEGEPTFWVGADLLDLACTCDPKARYCDTPPHLYNLDAVAYESLILGLFSIWRGQPQDRPKLNEIVLGYSRDGFHWDRPTRAPFIPLSERQGDWNWGNVQSAGGCCLVVGDKLYFYVSGRAGVPGRSHSGVCSTGLAILRRDGFASMRAEESEQTLTTRPVRFSGKYLFVNSDTDAGELRVEVLDRSGRVIAPFSRDNCKPVRSDKTLQAVSWTEGNDLANLVGRPVKFRFYLRNGHLYSFWVSPDKSGASHGYVAAGGPGFTCPRDTVGSAACR